MPIRGHSGVQGGAEMGAYATALPGRQADQRGERRGAVRASTDFRCRIGPGLTAPEMVEAARAANSMCSTASAEISCARCPSRTTSRAALAQRAAARASGHHPHRPDVHRARARTVILLPAKTRYEQDDGGTETTTERRIIFSPEIPRQVGEARAEWKILRELAAAVDPGARAAARLRNRRGDARGNRARRAVLRRHPASREDRRRVSIRRPASVRRLEISRRPTARRISARCRCRPREAERRYGSRSARAAANNSTRSSTPRSIRSTARRAMRCS